MSEKEFAINAYLTLKLEGNATVIYVNGKRFKHCKYLLLNVPVSEIESFNEIQSVDEAAEKLDRSLEPRRDDDDKTSQKPVIPPEAEFWGHCSNLQAWAEHDYDTRLLHSNIAFHLLKALVDVGDPIALKKFREEIGKRYVEGSKNVKEYLEEEGFIKYLTVSEYCSLFDVESEGLIELSEDSKIGIGIYDFSFESGKVLMLRLNGKQLTEVPEPVRKLTGLEELYLGNNLLETLPDWIGDLKSLKKLDLAQNRLTRLPGSIGELESLETLELFQTPLKELPDEIGQLKSLKLLNLQENALERLPITIGNLSSLKRLVLWKNKLKDVPDEIGNLHLLESLDLANNEITALPNSIRNLKSLEYLELSSNYFASLPESIGNLNSLKVLSIGINRLISIPNSIGNLSSLRELSLGLNKLISLPDSLQNLYLLESLDIRDNPIDKLPEWVLELPKLNALYIRETGIDVSDVLINQCKKKQISLFY